MSVDVRLTLGAALAGCIVTVGLSAVLGFQTFLYFQIFPSDAFRYKLLVAWMWATDAIHSVLICTCMWQYLILNFTDPLIACKIFTTIPVLVAMTGIITLSANALYGWRIHKMSRRNWWLTGPIAFLCLARLGLAFASTVEMIELKTFAEFSAKFKILFTCGLLVSAATDILVSGARYWYLRDLKQGYFQTQEAVDAVVVFTINDGLLTCLVAVAVAVCWLAMPQNFVYLGFYFTVPKLYSNSVLATLNLRNWYRHRYAWPRQRAGVSIMRGSGSEQRPHSVLPVPMPNASAVKRTNSDIENGRVEVYVERELDYSVDDTVRDVLQLRGQSAKAEEAKMEEA
ncbi:hypothetical protein GYMLUDRAFT_708930 [Collybiopsis luxurians FD-317 M1]|nr:hypothetical protein GYMLUDRAFT_708930 [Collybiopsis luxurians FD-317 M1]